MPVLLPGDCKEYGFDETAQQFTFRLGEFNPHR